MRLALDMEDLQCVSSVPPEATTVSKQKKEPFTRELYLEFFQSVAYARCGTLRFLN